MRIHAAFLRGVTPTNLKMVDLKAALEEAGFEEVQTILASGNVIFGAPPAPEAQLARKVEAAISGRLGRAFPAFVRPVDALREVLGSDPYRSFRLRPDSKRVVTFLRTKPKTSLPLPIELDGARILSVVGATAFSVYVPNPRGPVFMTLIERTFGPDVTTRTWQTIQKVVQRAER